MVWSVLERDTSGFHAAQGKDPLLSADASLGLALPLEAFWRLACCRFDAHTTDIWSERTGAGTTSSSVAKRGFSLSRMPQDRCLDVLRKRLWARFINDS